MIGELSSNTRKLVLENHCRDGNLLVHISKAMKVSITAQQLEILRKAVYGLTPDQIAIELRLNAQEVDKALKLVLKNTQTKEPFQAMQSLAKNGFSLTE